MNYVSMNYVERMGYWLIRLSNEPLQGKAKPLKSQQLTANRQTPPVERLGD